MIKRDRFGYAGTSIIEVLVAMVVLVIGIFGIIRVFPTGFGVIIYGGKVTQGEKLANGALEQARARGDDLPEAIVPVTLNAQNQVVPDPTLTPAVESDDFRDPNRKGVPEDPLQAHFFGLNRTRRVIGETTKIPSPTPNVPYMPADPGGSGRPQLVSIYTLQYGPIDAAGFRPVVYSGDTLTRVVFTQAPTPQDIAGLGMFRYGVIYQPNQMVLLFAPSAIPRTFRIQFAYTISDPAGPYRAQTRPDLSIMLGANQTTVPVTAPTNGSLEQGSERISRVFTEIPLTVPFSSVDPFQYKLMDPRVGIIGFNPIGALSQQANGTRAASAQIDYDVADWHIVTEDVVVPQEPPFRVKLTLNFLKRLEDTQDNQTIYKQLMPLPSTAPQDKIDLLVVDLDRGLNLDSRTLIPEVANDDGSINYQAGAVDFSPRVHWRLPTNDALLGDEPIAGRHVRIYYRTEDEFGLQVQKAFKNYLRAEVRLGTPPLIGPGQYGQYPNGFLVFPASDHNQTVLIDYSFDALPPGAATGATPRRIRVSGELQPIRDATTDTETPKLLFGDLTKPPADTLWFVRLNNRDRSNLDQPNDPGRPVVVPGSITIHSVKGVSVRSRVVWREGNRWRRLENSTVLSRGS